MRAALLVALGAGLASRTAAHPVERVIKLLQDLDNKAEQEGKEEEVSYTKFEYWCTNSAKTLNAAIVDEKKTIERLQDEIASHEKSIEVLTNEMAALTEEISNVDAQETKAKKERDDGEALYTENSAAHTATIQAIEQAIEALETSRTETDSKTLNLLQRRVRRVVALLGGKASKDQLSKLEGFASYEPKERPEFKASADYLGHVKKYSFKSDSVIELLKELRLQFDDELTTMNTEETNAANAFTLGQQARNQAKSAKQASHTEKEKIKGETSSALAKANSDLQSEQNDLSADSGELKTTEKACEVKQAEWMQRSEVRANERKAIAAAIKILAKATGVRTEAPKNPGPPPSPVEEPLFIQLLRRAAGPSATAPVQKAIQLLRSKAKLTHAHGLEQIAAELEARKDGPFDQVINAIQKMIFRLKDEQRKEDDHKNWCDLELSKTNLSIDDKADKLEELAAKIEDHEGSAFSLQEDITKANEMIASIDAHVEEATEIRKTGRMENEKAVKDAQEAQEALSNAISVLKDFYKSSGGMPKEVYELVQQRSTAPASLPESPATWDSSYTRVADPAAQPDGIVTVLETVSADFSQMESDTNAQEASDQELYDDDMKTCKIEKARRIQESEMKAQERKRVLQKKADMEKEHKRVDGEHEATVQYMKDLQPACVEGSSSYGDRKAARATEIEALAEAQGILQGAFEEKAGGDKFVQVQSQRRLRGVFAHAA